MYQTYEQYDIACTYFWKSVELLRSLVEEWPEILSYQTQLSSVIARIAHAKTLSFPNMMPKEAFGEVVSLYEESLEIRRNVFAKDPTNPDYLHRITIPQFRLAEVYESVGDDLKAKQFLEECLDIRKRLVNDYPQNPSFKRFLAQAHENAVFLMRRLGDEKSSKKYYG